MSDYEEKLAAIREARRERDQTHEQLYALELRRLELVRARQKIERGHAAVDPERTRRLRQLELEHTRLSARKDAIAARLAELAALPARQTELRAGVAAARTRSAELEREARALAEQLSHASNTETAPRSRQEIVARVRDAQAERAATEHAAAPLQEELAKLEAAAKSNIAEQTALQAESIATQSELDQRRARIEELSGTVEANELPGLAARIRDAIVAQREELAKRERAVRDAIGELYLQRDPETLLADWDDGVPILLLPLRLETRWKTEGSSAPELWIRVYPDDVAVTTHEPVLTDAELTHGRAYWTNRRSAATEELTAAAWRALAKRFSANRARWVARQTKPLNWDAALQDRALPLDFPDAPLTKPDAWTTAPHSRVLPDRFVVLGWRGTELKVHAVGPRIADVVVLGPSPLEDHDEGATITRDEIDQTLKLGESFRWVRDFEDAVRAGMAFRLQIDDDTANHGLDELVVVGLKHSASDLDAKRLVEDLIENHHFSRPGFELIAQGTATNNTSGNDSGYTRAGANPDDSALIEAGPARFSETFDRARASDGQRLADFLGIAYEPLRHVAGAEGLDHAEAVAMNRALYAGTLGYYLDHLLNEVVDEDALASLRRHMTDHVTGRGPLAAIRVGAQPYGILPTSAFERWRPPPENRTVNRFEPVLHRVLTRFDEAWSSVLPRLATLGAPGGDGSKKLLEILGLHPSSEELYQRVGYSYDTLRNLDALVWGGHQLADTVGMILEGLATRMFLSDLGYETERADGTTKPNPLLLHLIWRHYQTPLQPQQLIDGQPFSERAPIEPFDPASGKNYIDWLLEHASDADAMEAQDFRGAPAPSHLLYLLLRFSLTMEAGRGVRGWLGAHGVKADELIRSRKFLNIGPKPSPSMWEVLRAPANRVVQAEPSGRSLLEIVHSPQQAAGAGQFVSEQRAALQTLRGMTTARLERALVEHIDVLSYRLDAWQTSLFSRRLQRQRQLDRKPGERRVGIYLGAYGYLQNLRAQPAARRTVEDASLPIELRHGTANLFEQVGNGGFVHAPSMNHAAAAALLRNGYLTHATPEQPDALAVNLSSSRTRRARYLLDGIANGQTLEVLLGIQFERGLHDWTTRSESPVILDQLKPVFRAAFPIRRTRVPRATDAASGAGVITEDHQVVNGLDLARAGAFPWGIAELSSLSSAQQHALQQEKDVIANTLDALRDVLTAESAYQLALGNFERAAGVVQSIGDGTIPPDIEVLRTPRGTALSFTQRFAIQLSPAVSENPWPAVPALSERARVEPALNHWLGSLIADPQRIRCTVRAVHPDTGSELAAGSVALSDLGLQPIDFVYIVRSQAGESGVAELEARIRYAFARAHGVADDAIVRISFGDAGEGERSFLEVLPLADRLRRLLGAARPLHARHFQSASKDTPEPPDNTGRIDVSELRTRVGDRVAALRRLFRNPDPAAPIRPLESALAEARAPGAAPAAIDGLRTTLKTIADAGFAYALPLSCVGTEAAQLDALAAQAESVLQRFDALSAETDARLDETDTTSARADRKVELLTDIVKGWMGGDFVLLPRFIFSDPPAVAAAHAASDELLNHARAQGSLLPIDEWLHGAACVRPQVHAFEMVRTIAEASLDEPLTLAVLQLPFRLGDSWLGVEFPAETEVVHDTVSMVRQLPQGFDAEGPQSGLLIDEWVESIPSRREVTGLTFNFNAPNSAPPQALLLAVTPNETGSWSWDDLIATIRDTFRRARLRAVEPDQIGDLPGIGTLLPAAVAEFSTGRGSVSLDYSLIVSEIRMAAVAQALLSRAPEGSGE